MKYIELNQRADTLKGFLVRKIKVNIQQIVFYYDNRIVFNSRVIDVAESYDEITKLIKEAEK